MLPLASRPTEIIPISMPMAGMVIWVGTEAGKASLAISATGVDEEKVFVGSKAWTLIICSPKKIAPSRPANTKMKGTEACCRQKTLAVFGRPADRFPLFWRRATSLTELA